MMIRSGRMRKALLHQVGGGDGALALDIGRAGFQPHDVVLLQLQFGRVFDRHDAVGIGNEAGKRVQQRRLARAGAAGNEDVQPGLDGPFQQHHHFGREGPIVQQVFQLQRIGAETADGNAGAVQRQRRNDRIETRAVDHAGVDHRAGLVHAAAHLRNDAVDDLHQVVVVAEDNAGLLHLAAALAVDVLRAVDENVADRRVLQQHLQRPEAEGLVEHFAYQPLALVAVQQRVFGVAEVLDNQADFAAKRVALQFAHPRQVELVDQLAVDALLELLEVALFRIGGAQGGRSVSAWQYSSQGTKRPGKE